MKETGSDDTAGIFFPDKDAANSVGRRYEIHSRTKKLAFLHGTSLLVPPNISQRLQRWGVRTPIVLNCGSVIFNMAMKVAELADFD